ncbi:hypothetical protein OF83DRAFT_1084743, partial [Amylostereum chailletii]
AYISEFETFYIFSEMGLKLDEVDFDSITDMKVLDSCFRRGSFPLPLLPSPRTYSWNCCLAQRVPLIPVSAWVLASADPGIRVPDTHADVGSGLGHHGYLSHGYGYIRGYTREELCSLLCFCMSTLDARTQDPCPGPHPQCMPHAFRMQALLARTCARASTRTYPCGQWVNTHPPPLTRAHMPMCPQMLWLHARPVLLARHKQENMGDNGDKNFGVQDDRGRDRSVCAVLNKSRPTKSTVA